MIDVIATNRVKILKQVIIRPTASFDPIVSSSGHSHLRDIYIPLKGMKVRYELCRPV